MRPSHSTPPLISPTAILLAIGTIAVGLSSGGYPLGARTSAAVVVWWALIVAAGLSLWPRDQVPRAAIAAGALLAAFAALTGLSVLWAPGAEAAVADFNRATLYLGVFLLAVLASRRGTTARWANGLALGLAVLGLLALASRCFPGTFPDGELRRLLPSAETRLSYPIDYWNALAIAIGMTFPLLLRAAVEHGSAVLRGLWLAPFPALATALYLTSSRGGFAVAAVGLIAFLALAGSRLLALGQAMAVALAGSLAAILAVRSRPQLVDGPLDGTVAAAGGALALEVVLICVVTALVHALVSSTGVRRVQVGRRGLVASGALGILFFGVAAASADVPERLREFRQPQGFVTPDQQDFVSSHLLSGGGSGRWQFWSAAVDQWREAPVFGGGAGSYESWWAQSGTLSYFVRNAHSAFAETLGELGIVGLLLLAGAFATALAGGLARLRHLGEARLGAAALLSVSAGFVVGAGVDWIWEVPVVAGAGFLVLGLAVGPATLPAVEAARAAGRAPSASRRSRYAPGLAGLVAAWVVVCAHVAPWLVDRELKASRAASAQGDAREALERAEQARTIGPWTASSHLQLAVVQEQAGDLPAARRSIAEAIERSERDWRLRVTAARIELRAGRVDEARRNLSVARMLSPRSPLLASILRDAEQ